ncbi:MAG: hypothetical protein UDP17_11345 [Treponema sp.]|uniref:hypothetical protein n=1 Tax=Treponema sp. TaxID=166 RepID=UPI00280B06CD|nr:hypothetical protein [uncultured Treponema sp.]MEE0353926.1 hypothetical protein [Treponema sp.]
MQISKTSIVLALTAAAVFNASAQSTSFSSITSPSMPTISSPEIGNGFYSPGSVLKPEYIKNTSQNNSSQSEKTKAENKNAESSNAKSEMQKKILSALSAKDISLLNEKGFSSDINSMIFSLSSSDNSQETKILLNKILAEIEKIKDKSSQDNSKKKTAEVSAAPAKEEKLPEKAKARLLRFSVNGYDILRTCRKIYISEVQLDGTFLITGDRVYSSDGKNRTETFHILFKTSPNENGTLNYKAAANVTQDYLNENSFLYQLSKFESLPAMRVGNLVSMRTEDPNWKLELLIDLGEQA